MCHLLGSPVHSGELTKGASSLPVFIIFVYCNKECKPFLKATATALTLADLTRPCLPSLENFHYNSLLLSIDFFFHILCYASRLLYLKEETSEPLTEQP